jgi:hypothetical protein
VCYVIDKRHLMIARVSLPFAWVAFVLGLLTDGATDGRSLAVLVPAGLFLITRGALMLRRPHTVLAPLAQREAATFWGREGLRIEHRFGAVMLLIIGSGWAAMGIAYGVGV